MREVAVLGAGSGGLAAAADLGLRGYSVRLFNRSSGPLEHIERSGGIRVLGALGEGVVEMRSVTASLPDAIDEADVVVVVLPATAHEEVGSALAKVLDDSVPIVLNPGHMCGSLHMRRVFARAGRRARVAEFGTLTYVCRSHRPATVDVYLRAHRVSFSTVPCDDELAGIAEELFPGTLRTEEPLETWLWDVNMILHPPGMILGASRIEATGGDFTYYVEGITRSVATLMRALDAERIAVGRAYGVDVLPLEQVMATLGTADQRAADAADLETSIRKGVANATIRAPSQLDHRYLHEDVAFGLVPLAVVGSGAGIAMPITDAAITLAGCVTGRDYRTSGLNAAVLGLQGADRAQVLAASKGSG